MRAMVFEGVGRPLAMREVSKPEPGPGEVLIRVAACGVCRTDLHIVEGDLTEPKPDLIPGHEVVGHVERLGEGVVGLPIGQRVGVPWLGTTCGTCGYCGRGEENLCDEARFTGYNLDGGYAEFAVAHQDACYPLPDCYSDVAIAPLLCAGLIGYRSYRMAGDAEKLGFYGFGAAAHILCQVARHQGREVYAFSRPGDEAAQELARSLGATWAGDSTAAPPADLDAAIIFAPVGALVPESLRQVRKGGRVICAGIHMSDIPGFPYADLWGERTIKSVANLTRSDGEGFLEIAGQLRIETTVTTFALDQANEALDVMARGELTGAAVLKVG